MPLYISRPQPFEAFVWTGSNFSELHDWYTARGGVWTCEDNGDGTLTIGTEGIFGSGPGTAVVQTGWLVTLQGRLTTGGDSYIQEVGAGPSYAYNITEA